MLTTCHPYPQKLALTSPTSSGRSVGIVCSRTQALEFSFFFSLEIILRIIVKTICWYHIFQESDIPSIAYEQKLWSIWCFMWDCWLHFCYHMLFLWYLTSGCATVLLPSQFIKLIFITVIFYLNCFWHISFLSFFLLSLECSLLSQLSWDCPVQFKGFVFSSVKCTCRHVLNISAKLLLLICFIFLKLQ
jgi:hypothetical protein